MRLLTKSAAACELNTSLPTFEQLMQSPDFPKTRKLGKRHYYLATELHAWLLSQPAEGGPGDAA
jgi:hypothetical protein